MDWSASIGWWIAAAVLVAAELGTGTIYVLMVALGAVAGAVAALAAESLLVQAVAAGAVGGGAVVAWHLLRRREPAPPPVAANPDVNLDVGERVAVSAWNADGTARVSYRGAGWNARYVGEGAPRPGPHVIAEMRHNELALRRAD